MTNDKCRIFTEWLTLLLVVLVYAFFGIVTFGSIVRFSNDYNSDLQESISLGSAALAMDKVGRFISAFTLSTDRVQAWFSEKRVFTFLCLIAIAIVLLSIVVLGTGSLEFPNKYLIATSGVFGSLICAFGVCIRILTGSVLKHHISKLSALISLGAGSGVLLFDAAKTWQIEVILTSLAIIASISLALNRVTVGEYDCKRATGRKRLDLSLFGFSSAMLFVATGGALATAVTLCLNSVTVPVLTKIFRYSVSETAVLQLPMMAGSMLLMFGAIASLLEKIDDRLLYVITQLGSVVLIALLFMVSDTVFVVCILFISGFLGSTHAFSQVHFINRFVSAEQKGRAHAFTEVFSVLASAIVVGLLKFQVSPILLSCLFTFFIAALTIFAFSRLKRSEDSSI